MIILNFGSCNIDMVYSMDHIVLPGSMPRHLHGAVLFGM